MPIFVLEWWKNGAPDRMKLGTLMSLLFRLFHTDAQTESVDRGRGTDP